MTLSAPVIRFLILVISIGIISARTFRPGEIHPSGKDEISTCGNIRDVIRRNSARFRKILVRNTNAEIVFLNDDARRMTARAKSKLDVLGSRVKTRWPGRKLKVLKAWTDQVVPGKISLHYEGRAIQLKVDDDDKNKLGELAGLAVQAGFDWIYYTRNNYVHASVIRDVCQTSIDLAFILDTSGSVGSYNFEKIKTFVKNVIDFFNIGRTGTHVAVVTYSTWSEVEFNLQQYFSKTSLKSAVSQIYYRAGWTYTGDALETTRTDVFNTAYGMRPDKGIPKVAVLLTDGYSNGWGVTSAANALKNQGVNIFSIGVGNYNRRELNDIATDPDSTHVFTLDNFNDLSTWVDKLSSVSCDEGAAVSSCDDTTSSIDGGSFLYFKTKFESVTGGISVEVKDIEGISHLYVSLATTNPGPMDPNSLKNEMNTSPRSVRMSFNTVRSSSTFVYVAVQGQMNKNKFKLSMWDTLFKKDSYDANPVEEQQGTQNVITVASTVTKYRLEYSIIDGNTAGKFQINRQTGLITAMRLDREDVANYRLTVLAQDIDNRCHKGRTVVNVNVRDINDNRPTFPKTLYQADVKENARIGTSVAIVTANDRDTNDTLSYSILNKFNTFSIDSNGLIKTMAGLDYEQTNSYRLEIRASDGKNEAKTFLHIQVLNVNEPPVFRDACAKKNLCSFKVIENQSINTVIGTLNATDPDVGDRLSYKLKMLDSQDDVFVIDASGRIALKKTLDREVKPMYSLLVTVSDDGAPTLATHTTVSVIVTDYNDETPTFSSNTYTASVYENAARGSTVIQVIAVDADIGSNSKLTYSILQGGDSSFFTIDSNQGIIKTTQPFDRETKSSYRLSIRVVDGGVPQRDAQTSVAINVLDVNDNKPLYTNNTYTVKVLENVQVGATVASVSASDRDTGINADLRYYIVSGNQDNTFGLDSKTGLVRLAGALDYERRTSYSLAIGVSDRGLPSLSSTANLVINVQDVNDNSPVFTSSVYRATVKENSPKRTSVIKLLATDRDSGLNGAVEYNITIGNDDTFMIDLNSGLITIKNPPKFKTKSQYDLTVQARDKGQPIRTDSAQVTITIEDVNDNKPIFGQQKYSVQVLENVAIGTTVLTVAAKDEDTGPRGRVVYSILSGNVGNKFTIDGSSGSIKVSLSLDREMMDAFTLTIEARDGGTPPLSSTTQVLINVTDINDNIPAFNGPYTFHVSEAQNAGYLVGKVVATDRDKGENGRVTYSGSTNVFAIDPVSGNITLAKKVDHETKSSYALTVTASDHGSPPRSSSIIVKAIVDDVNDNPPKFPQDMYNCSVAENLGKGATVCYVTATDPDSSANGQLRYSLDGGNGTFLINSGTGEITTTVPLDRETTAYYQLIVTVRDGFNSRSVQSFSDSVTVYVTVQDENDNAPIFSGGPYKFTIKEDAKVGSSVGTVSAVDADTGPSGEITYSIVQGNTEQKFRIDPKSGVISVQTALDREQTDQYSLTVQARDSGSPVPQSTNTVVQVTIEDVNDHAPSFQRKVFHGQIREDASIGSSVLQVRAVDNDQGTNARLTFALSGQGSDNFTIDSTGFVKSSTALDYETTSSYLLTVMATDSGNPPLNDTAKVNITIINVNDNVPTFDSTGQITSIPEDVAIGTRVVKLNATDSDGSKLTFDIVRGNIGGSFIIGSETGVISVAKRLDRESIANYTLVVKATDTGGKSVSNNATVQVLDVNDNKPVFEQLSYSVSLLENKPKGTSIARVHATDRDLGKNAEITYQITSGDTTKFQIDPTTGLITTLTTLDREQQQTYQLAVTAKDHGTPSQSSVVIVTVTVNDVNDNKPRFAQSSFSVSLVENTARKSVVLRLRAVDPDDGNNGRVTYDIISGNTNDAFKIDSDTGVISVLNSIDRETKASYNLTVRASDSGTPPLNSTTSISITITDENDNAPVFTNQNSSFSVKENAPQGTLIGVVMATDADVRSNAKVVYSITQGAQNVFAINPSTGRITTVNGGIDRETMATYRLTIRASDRGSPVLFTDKLFTVRVEDVNDNTPAFEKSLYRANIREDSPRQSSVVVVKATDADLGANAALRYQIVSGNQGLFTINAITGLINTAGPLDYETQSKYTFEVSATDSAKTTKARVIIDVVDVNDNKPVFSQRAYFANVQENKLTQVLSVSATDKDPFGGLVYSLNSSYPSSKQFNIDPYLGVISTADALDRETKDEYEIQVVVADGGTPARTDTALVTINVTDVNDNRPSFNDNTYSVAILENVTINTIVTTIHASDRDLGSNAILSYSMSQSSFFTIESATGIIRNIKTLDREATPSYTLTCMATDNGSPKLTSQRVTIHVTLQDVNDNVPRFDQKSYKANVSENEDVGVLVTEVVAVDRDLGDAGTVVYRITNGNDNGMFTIDNSTGIISLLKQPDREVQDSYTLKVQASDLGTSPLSSTTKVYINILDVNDNVPKFNKTSLRGSVRENKPAGTYVMRLTASDADSGSNARIQFEFQTGEYENLFSLNKSTGEIKTKTSLDRERQERYVLKIQASDMGNPRLTSLVDVIIDVIDEDDNCPTFQYSEYNTTIFENVKIGTEIDVQILATDVDQENVTYYIKSGNPAGAFTIDRKTGKIKVANPDGVDREKHQTFNLIVRAGSENCGVNETDGGNTAEGGVDILSSATTTVNIIVKDVNDNPPEFKESAYEFEFNDIKTTRLFTISATDTDLGEGGVVKYKMAGQTEVDGNHVARITAYDQGSPSLESSVTVTVKVRSGLSCEAMVFNVSSGGDIHVKTLCHFDDKPTSNIVFSGQRHELLCSAKGNTVPQYRWMLDGSILTTYSLNGTYVIERLSQEDEGSYSCLASSEAGIIQSPAATLTVHERPKVILHPKNSSASLGSTAILECRATGDPEPKYRWYKGDVPIPASDGIEPNKPKLVLRNAIIQDQAWYHCSFINTAGNTLSNAAYLQIFKSEALVSLEISVSKPNYAKRCHIFELEAFKQTLNKVLEAEATITNMTVLAENLCESDPCFSNPCMNGGVCKVSGKNDYTCRCKPGWAGRDCGNDINECERGPCRNGTCTNTPGNYHCKCSSSLTGKNCNLRRNACAGDPCNETQTCVLSEMHSAGHKCLSKENIIEMEYSKVIAGDEQSTLNLEKRMRDIIISAQDNNANNSNVNARRRKRDANENVDYGTCVVRIQSVSGKTIKFVLLCPKELNANQNVIKQYVCGLMIEEKATDSCGSGANKMTAAPPITYRPMNPMRVRILLFGRDQSNRDIDSERLMSRLRSKAFQEQMSSQGVEFVAAKQVRPKHLKRNNPSNNTGLAIGLSIFALLAIAVAIVGFLYYQRSKNRKKTVNLEDRAILRRDNGHQNVQRNVSTKDIARSEKKYINQAFNTDSVYDDDDEGEFMVEVNLSSPKKKVTPVLKLLDQHWYYDKITSIEAEELLDAEVQPGVFLVRKGINPDEYVLTVKCPDGGPPHRHLLLKYTNKQKFEVQFGSMPLALEFDTVDDVIDHFQVTTIEFGPNVPDVVLTNGWCKSQV